MLVYTSPKLPILLHEKTTSKALIHAALSFCCYLYEMMSRIEAASIHGVLYSSRTGHEIYTPQIYTATIRLLKQEGVIEQTGKHRVGEKPKAYRLTVPYLDVQPLEIDAPRLAERIGKAVKEHARTNACHHKWLRDVYRHRVGLTSRVANVLDAIDYKTPEQRTLYTWHYHRFQRKLAEPPF